MKQLYSVGFTRSRHNQLVEATSYADARDTFRRENGVRGISQVTARLVKPQQKEYSEYYG